MKWPRSRILELVAPSQRIRGAPHGIDAAVTLSRSIAREVLALHAADVDTNARFPIEAIDALRRHGLLGLGVPAA